MSLLPIVAFDVDGTLIWSEGYTNHEPDTPRYDIIGLYKLFQKFGYVMVIWSGGGKEYAKRWAEKLGLHGCIYEKGEIEVDIAVDDEEVRLGKVNLKV
jgi:trehalose-6-phosphatase